MANSLNVVLSLDTKPFERAIKGVERQLSAFSQRLSNIGSTLTTSVTVPLAGLGAVAVKSFGEIEKLEKALAAVTGLAPDSAELRAELEKLRKVAESPGLGFEQVVKASARLQAVGLNADQARETIEQFGNAVARSGGGREEFEGTIQALGQIAAKGKVYAEEINQINERIFEIRPALQAAFGTSNTEELAELGISSEEFIAKITKEFAKLERVNGGLANSFENFRDNAQQAFAILGREIANVFDLQGGLDRLSASLRAAADWFAGLDDNVKRNIIQIGLFAAAIGPALLIIGKLTSVLSVALVGVRNLAAGVRLLAGGVAFLLSPIGLAIAGIAALAAGIVYAYQKSETFRRGVNGIIEVILELAKIAKESFAALLRGFSQLKEGKFKQAAKSFGEAIVKANPIGIAFTQGNRLGAAFADGFTDESSRIDEGINKIKDVFKSAQKSVGGALGFDLGGGSAFGDTFARNATKEQKQGIQQVKSALDELASGLKAVDSQAQLSGETFDTYTAKIKVLGTALEKLLQAGVSPAGSIIQDVKRQIDELRGESFDIAPLATLDTKKIAGNILPALSGISAGFQQVFEPIKSLNEESSLLTANLTELGARVNTIPDILTSVQERALLVKEAFADFSGTISNAVNTGLADLAAGIGETLGNLASGAGSLRGIGDVIANIMESVGRAAIALGIQLAAIKLSIKSLNPALAILGGTLLIAAAKLFKNKINQSVPKLAQGGIVPPGFPNDTFPAFLTSGEAVIPLDKLNSMIGGGGEIRLTGTFGIKGEDLELSLERTRQEKKRIR